jgi:hypothetical protein
LFGGSPVVGSDCSETSRLVVRIRSGRTGGRGCIEQADLAVELPNLSFEESFVGPSQLSLSRSSCLLISLPDPDDGDEASGLVTWLCRKRIG